MSLSKVNVPIFSEQSISAQLLLAASAHREQQTNLL